MKLALLNKTFSMYKMKKIDCACNDCKEILDVVLSSIQTIVAIKPVELTAKTSSFSHRNTVPADTTSMKEFDDYIVEKCNNEHLTRIFLKNE